MQTKAIIFDCFGVIASRALGGWIPDNLGKDFSPDRIFDKIDIGDISEDDALLELSRLVDRPPSIVRKEIDSYFKPNLILIEFIGELKSENYKIILLSNATHSFFERFIYVEYPWFRGIFDDIIISSAVRMTKPNSDIFQYTLTKNNLDPEECIFIDDSPANVAGAENVGMPAILFRDVDQLKQELLKHNINLNEA